MPKTKYKPHKTHIKVTQNNAHVQKLGTYYRICTNNIAKHFTEIITKLCDNTWEFYKKIEKNCFKISSCHEKVFERAQLIRLNNAKVLYSDLVTHFNRISELLTSRQQKQTSDDSENENLEDEPDGSDESEGFVLDEILQNSIVEYIENKEKEKYQTIYLTTYTYYNGDRTDKFTKWLSEHEVEKMDNGIDCILEYEMEL
jgi:hypothetical protein